MTIKPGSYKILSPLGAGGMGEVYLAEDVRLHRKVALKVLPEALAQDKDRFRRFEQEAFAASALNHPNILTIYEFGTTATEAGETHFLASEFIDGETLRARMQREPLALNEALDITVQTAQALTAAHEAKIIHRDIKPENVMLRKDGIVKVLDFGLAKLIEREPLDAEAETRKLGLTQAGTVMGTVAYMSPEQARGETVDERTDIFSLGVMLYEMIARRQPFTGATVNHVIVAILENEPAPLSEDTPAELGRIVQQMLAKRLEDRYGSAQDLLADLKKLQIRLLLEAEQARASSSSEDGETLMVKPATTAGPEAKATAAGNPQGTTPDNPKLGRRWMAALLVLVALAVGLLAYLSFTPSNQGIESLAVLPFENHSANADSEYLSDGLAESLIYRLSQLPNLRVSPTSSVFRYKGKDTDPQVIAKELGVDSVMTGRITQRGDNLTLSVNLVDARIGKSLWGEQYERKMSELLATQREIAAEITRKLQLKLSGDSAQKLAKRYTENDQANQLYLRGRFHLAKRTKDDILKGIDYFEQATKLDPSFALAYATIAESHNVLGKNADLAPNEVLPQAKAAATRALEIDSTLAEAHGALADTLAVYDWNWAESEREYAKAFQLDPNVSYIHLTHGVSYLVPLGRRDEAVAELRRAMELEPLSLIASTMLSASYMYAGQHEKALEQQKKTYDLDPDFRFGRQYLGYAYIALGRYDDAIALAEKGLKTSPLSQHDLAIGGLAYAKSGRRREVQQYLARFADLAKANYVRTVYTASIYAALGDRDKAFAELERAFQVRDYFLPRIKLDPFMDPLRDDPRFKDLLRRMNLPE